MEKQSFQRRFEQLKRQTLNALSLGWTQTRFWVKRHWKWLLVPFFFIGCFVLYLVGLRKTKPEEAQESLPVDKIVQATEEREKALEALEKKYASKVSALKESQRIKLQEIKKKSVDDVARWLDKL